MVTKSAFELMFGFQPIPHEIESRERARLQRLKKKNERQKESKTKSALDNWQKARNIINREK